MAVALSYHRSAGGVFSLALSASFTSLYVIAYLIPKEKRTKTRNLDGKIGEELLLYWRSSRINLTSLLWCSPDFIKAFAKLLLAAKRAVE